MPLRTHYDNLKVARNAPEAVIRAAYRVLMQKFHPDKFTGSPEAAERISKIIQGSFSVLSDPVKRAAHDAWIAEQEQEGSAQYQRSQDEANQRRQREQEEAERWRAEQARREAEEQWEHQQQHEEQARQQQERAEEKERKLKEWRAEKEARHLKNARRKLGWLLAKQFPVVALLIAVGYMIFALFRTSFPISTKPPSGVSASIGDQGTPTVPTAPPAKTDEPIRALESTITEDMFLPGRREGVKQSVYPEPKKTPTAIESSAFLSRIALNKTFIREGNFYVLLYDPQKIVTPTENRYSRVTDYSYMSYFESFDVSYTASYSDWRAAKQREIEKYGFSLFTVERELKNTVDGMLYYLKQRVGNTIKLNWVNDIKYKNFPGKEAEFEFSPTNEIYFVKCRFYIINDQTYSLANVFPKKYIGITQFQRFLDSFELK